MSSSTDAVDDDYRMASRLRRALTQRIYVLGFDLASSRFDVQGSSDSVYEVVVLPKPTCTCLDFTFHWGRMPCKHILNVLARVLRVNADVYEHRPFNPMYYTHEVVRAMDLLAAQYREVGRVGLALPNTPTSPLCPPLSPVQPKMDVDCCICFEVIEDGAPTWTCRVCGHRVDAGCWERWRRRSQSCPLCRSVSR